MGTLPVTHTQVMGSPPLFGDAPGASRVPGDAESSFSLVLRAREGDEEARARLLARYQKRLAIWAHGRLPPHARHLGETMDLVQDTLVQVVKALHTFEPRHAGAFLGLVRKTLNNKLVDWIRQAKTRPSGDPIDERHPGRDPSPSALFVETELIDRYEAALERLRPKDREAIILRIELRLPWTDVTDALALPSVPAAQMAVRRALVRLAREMNHELS